MSGGDVWVCCRCIAWLCNSSLKTSHVSDGRPATPLHLTFNWKVLHNGWTLLFLLHVRLHQTSLRTHTHTQTHTHNSPLPYYPCHCCRHLPLWTCVPSRALTLKCFTVSTLVSKKNGTYYTVKTFSLLHSTVYIFLSITTKCISSLYLCRRWSSTKWTVSRCPAIWYTTSSNSMWVASAVWECVVCLLTYRSLRSCQIKSSDRINKPKSGSKERDSSWHPPLPLVTQRPLLKPGFRPETWAQLHLIMNICKISLCVFITETCFPDLHWPVLLITSN